MSDSDDPTRKLMDIWAEAARGYTDAVQSFWEQAAPVPAGAEEASQQWQRNLAAVSALQATFVERLLDGLPDAASAHLDASTFSQLHRLREARWAEDLQRLAEFPTDPGAGSAPDPQRMSGLWQSMWDEYLRDLDAMPDDAFKLDLQPLAEAWGKVIAGEDDEAAHKVVDRLMESVAVKARWGGEYYADPDGTAVGQTPRECVYEQGAIKLYRYELPAGAEPVEPADAPPVLVVYSVINKPYILDLMPGFSFIEHLLGQGLDVYLIDWGEARPDDRETTLDSLIDPGIHGCVQAIEARTGAAQVSLFGHCIGGNLALLYAAIHPDRVARLITLTTPITAAEGGVVALWTDRELFPVDAIVDAYGLMPAKLIRTTFMAIKPYYEVLKWKMFLENLGNDAVMTLFYPVDRWANENVDIPGEVFRKFVSEVFHDGRFARGETRIHGQRADLKAITCPLMNLAAGKDWIVPPPSAEILGTLVGSEEQQFVLIDGAHVGVMIDPRARSVWAQMSDFLCGDEEPSE